MENKIKIENIEFSILLPFFYILSQYSTGKILENLGNIFLVLLIILKILFKKKIYVNKYFIYLLSFYLLRQFIALLFEYEYNSIYSYNVFIGIVLSSIILIGSTCEINDKIFYKTYVFIGYITAIGILIQLIQIMFLHQSVSPIVIFKNLDRDIYNLNTYRPLSFFFEPQAYASFILPIVIMSINKKYYINAILFSISIILSTSTQGVIILSVLWIYHISIEIKTKYYKKIIFLLITFAIILIGSSIQLFEITYSKIRNTDITQDIRIAKGFQVYSEINLGRKIFGIGYKNLNTYASKNNLKSPLLYILGESMTEYLPTLSGQLIYFGIIGFFAYISFILNITKKIDKKYLILILLSSISQTVLFNSWMIFYLSIIFSENIKNNNLNMFLVIKKI